MSSEADDFPIEYYDYIKFYQDSVQPQLKMKGEAYIEWAITETNLVDQLNYLEKKYKLKTVWFEKPDNPDWICIFIKPEQKSL